MRIVICANEPCEVREMKDFINKLDRKDALEVTSFQHAEDCIKFLQQHPAEIVILDLYLKDMFGITLAKKLRQLSDTFKLIFISEINSYATETYEVNASGYLLKPLDEKVFLNTMKKLV